MEEDELVMNESAYEMYHQNQTNAPCLSFDIIKDDLGQNRTDYPHTCFMVSGTHAEPTQPNNLIVMKMSNLKRTFKEQKEEDDEESDSDSEDEDEKSELEAALVRHSGTVNRVRATRFDDKVLAATWSELGRVYIWDLTEPSQAVSDSKLMSDFV